MPNHGNNIFYWALLTTNRFVDNPIALYGGRWGIPSNAQPVIPFFWHPQVFGTREWHWAEKRKNSGLVWFPSLQNTLLTKCKLASHMLRIFTSKNVLKHTVRFWESLVVLKIKYIENKFLWWNTFMWRSVVRSRSFSFLFLQFILSKTELNSVYYTFLSLHHCVPLSKYVCTAISRVLTPW